MGGKHAGGNRHFITPPRKILADRPQRTYHISRMPHIITKATQASASNSEPLQSASTTFVTFSSTGSMTILPEPFRNRINVAEGPVLSKTSWSESFTPVTGKPL
jgi:hypothetical protein